MGDWVRRNDDAAFLRGWQPAGIELAPPDLRPVIVQRAWRRRFWANPPVVVAAEDFVAMDEAGQALQRRGVPWPSIKHAIADGLVHIAF